MTIIESLNFIKRALDAHVTVLIKAIKTELKTLRPPIIQEVKGKVGVDFPKTQRVEGQVTIINPPKTIQIEGLVHTDTTPKFNLLFKWLVETKASFINLFTNKGIKIANLPEYPTDIKVSNFPAPPQPAKLDVSGLERELKKVTEQLVAIPKTHPKISFPDLPAPQQVHFPKSLKVDNLESLKSDDPTAYIPVRLSDGGAFYEALQTMQQAVTNLYAYVNAEGVNQKALVDNDKHVQVDVLTMPETPTPEVANPAIVLSYNAAGDVVQIDKTTDGFTTTKTISNADTTIVSTKTISE